MYKLHKIFSFINVFFVFSAQTVFIAARAMTLLPTDEIMAPAVVEGVDLTVYNQNRALIKQTHEFDLDKGLNQINWNNLAPTLDIHSVSLSSLNPKKSIVVTQQHYTHNLLNTNTILAQSIDKTVYIKPFSNDGNSEERSGTLLSYSPSQHNCLIKIGNRYVINSANEIALAELPAGLPVEPNLSFVIQTKESAREKLLLTYEASNINWQCDYVLVLNNEQNKFDLTGWVTIDNQSSLKFKNANLKLVAGNIPNHRPVFTARSYYLGNADTATASMKEQAFADYHLYTFPEPVDINNNEITRLALIERKAIPVIKKYVFDQQYFSPNSAEQNTPLQVKLEFQNDEQYKQPLAAGQIKIYQKDSDQELQLIGEDRINHTATGEKVTVKLGDAFDVLGERSHTDSEQIATHHRKDTYKVTFYNHLDKDIIITDIEHIPDLALFNSDASFNKLNSNTFQCDIKVAANSKTELTYSIESKI